MAIDCALQPCDMSRKLVRAFDAFQLDDVSVSKGVKILRKIYDGQEKQERKIFFKYFTHILKLPLSRGTSKDRMNSYEEKVYEVVCQFATSFLQDNKEGSENCAKTGGNNDDEDVIVELPPFLRRFFDWLLDHHEVESSGARLKVCMLINRLLKLLGEEAEINDELYQKIYDNMLERLKDKVAEIRAQAVNALQRLQDPKDDQCPIIKAFIFHMACDPSPAVRRSIVRCIGATKITLSHVIKRTMDVDENVRKAAYKFIADKVHIRSMTISKREEIIRRGLTDRNEKVKDLVAKTLVPAWLRFCNDNIVELLYALDVGNSDGSTAKEVLSVLFRGVPYEELVGAFQYLDPTSKLIPHDKLSPETASYWRNLAEFLHNESEVRGVAAAAPHLENILPELTHFCSYVRNHLIENHPVKQDGEENFEATAMAWLFCGKQLIHMISLFDLADAAGRNNLLALIKELLLSKNVPQFLVEPLMRIHRTVQTNPQSRIQDVAEIISELRDPMKVGEELELDGEAKKKEEDSHEDIEEEKSGYSKGEKDKLVAAQQRKKVDIAKLKVKLNILRDELEKAISDREFIKAQELQLEIEELDEKQQKLVEELALIVVPKSVEKSVKTKTRIEPVTQQEEPPASSSSVVTAENSDPKIILKCLSMLVELLQSPDINSLNATLQTILDEFVKASVSSLDVQIRNVAVKALGGFSLRSLDVAKESLLLILQIAHLDMVSVRLTALEAIFDMLLWYGLTAFIDADGASLDATETLSIEAVLDSVASDNLFNGGQLTQQDLKAHGGNPVVAIISKLLDDRDLEVRTKVTEGLCKLMMSKVITSSKLFTRLILMWYNPVTDGHGKLRHILGAFFPLFASLSVENQNTIEEAFLPTLKTLFSAPVTSPLNEVDVEDVGLFLLQLTDRRFLQTKEASAGENNCHDSIAYSICNHIIGDPVSFHVKLLLKLLNSLQISVDDFSKLKELKVLQTEMSDAVKEKLSQKMVEKFGKTLDLYLAQNPAPTPVKEAEPPQVSTNPNEETMNNTTRLFRKRPLFSQTLNMLEEGHETPSASEKPLTAMVRDATNIVACSDDEEDIFATPKSVRTVHRVDGELEITKVEESPLSCLDATSENSTTDEIVAGNLTVGAEKAKRRQQRRKLVDSDEEGGASIITSTQIEPRRSSKRLSQVGSKSATEEDQEEKATRGRKPVEVKSSRPQRKSRQLDSSAGSSDSSSSKTRPKRTKRV